MGRGLKIAVAALVGLLVLLGINAMVTGAETKSAEVTVPDGRVVELPGGDLQAVEHGPRDGSPIVLLHCFTCAIDWWDGMMSRLTREHRVVAVDLLGHGGSEKPDTGYTIENQANLVAQALNRLGVRDAEVVGHSLGGAVAVALAEQSPDLVNRVVIIDTRSSSADEGDLGLVAGLAFAPVVGEALWRIKPDFAVRQGLEVAFAPGYEVPDAFVEDVDRMTFSAYDDSPQDFDDYSGERTLAERIRATGKPVLVMMGSEEQIIDDPAAALEPYRAVGAKTELIEGVGHSPNVEAPARTAAMVLAFGEVKTPANRGKQRATMQVRLQNQDGVRGGS